MSKCEWTIKSANAWVKWVKEGAREHTNHWVNEWMCDSVRTRITRQIRSQVNASSNKTARSALWEPLSLRRTPEGEKEGGAGRGNEEPWGHKTSALQGHPASHPPRQPFTQSLSQPVIQSANSIYTDSQDFRSRRKKERQRDEWLRYFLSYEVLILPFFSVLVIFCDHLLILYSFESILRSCSDW